MLVVDLRNTRISVYNYSVVGNKNSDTIYFYYPKKYQNYEVYVKALGQNVADKFRIHEPDIEVKDDCIRAKWVMPQSVTTNKDLQVQLEYDITLLGGGEIAQSKIVALKLQNTLDINGEVEPVYPSVLQELREDLDAEILHRQQGDTALHDEIVAENERAEAVEGGLRTDLDNHTADKTNPHEVTKEQVGLGNADNTSDIDKPISTAQQQALDNKVDKVTGKGLSTNDFTDALKEKLNNIEAGAQVNTLEVVKVNNQPLTPANKEINIDLTPYAEISDMQTYGKSLAVSIDPQTYVLTMSLKDANGNTLNSQEVDLPLETMVVSGSYDDTTKSLILVLKNGQTITIPVAELVAGLVSETQLATILADYYTKVQTNNLLAKKPNIYDTNNLWFDELESEFIAQLKTGDTIVSGTTRAIVIEASETECSFQSFEYDTNWVNRFLYYYDASENSWLFGGENDYCLMPAPNDVGNHHVLRSVDGSWNSTTAPAVYSCEELTEVNSWEIEQWQLGDIIIYNEVVFEVTMVSSNTKKLTGIDISASIDEPNVCYDYIFTKNGSVWSYSERYDYQVGTKAMRKVTWEQLKLMRDNSELIAGQQYRITDYETFTDQPETSSAGNRFDIIVTADDENHLNEKARACHSVSDNILYSMLLSSSWGLAVRHQDADGYYNGELYYAYKHTYYEQYIYTKSLTEIPNDQNVYYFYSNQASFCKVQEAIGVEDIYQDGENIEKYTGLHFITSKVEAWELWYCLDNDTTRFAWAKNEAIRVKSVGEGSYYVYIRYPIKDIDGKYAWAYTSNNDATNFDEVKNWLSGIDDTDIIYTDTLEPSVGDILDMQGENVEVQSIREKGKGVIYRMIDEYGNDVAYDFKNIMFRRICVDDDDSEFATFDGKYVGVNDELICESGSYYPKKYTYSDRDDYRNYYTFCWFDEDNKPQDYSILGNTSLYNDEGHIAGCYNNKIEKYMGCDYPMSQLLRQWLNNNTFVDEYNYNDGVTNGYYNNSIRENSYGNTFLDYAGVINNVIRNNFQFNTVQDGFDNNVIDKNFMGNQISSAFSYNNIGTDFKENEIAHQFFNNKVGNNVQYNLFRYSFENNELHNYISHSSFAHSCWFNIIESNNSLVLTSDNENGEIRYVHVHANATSNEYRLEVARELQYTTDYYKDGSTEYYI